MPASKPRFRSSALAGRPFTHRGLRNLARGAAVLGVVAQGVLLSAPPALAVVTCVFEPLTRTAAIAFGLGDGITVTRSGNEIHVNGSQCGISPLVAEVTTTDTVTFVDTPTGNESLTIDLSGGPFAPGFTVEGSGTSEIEFSGIALGGGTDSLSIVGSSGADTIAFSGGGVDLNGDGDVDVTFGAGGLGAIEAYTLNGAGGDDTGSATGFTQPLVLNGSAGDDVLSGGSGNDQINGGTGSDTASYASASAAVTVDLSVTGTQNTKGAGSDTLTAIERLIGSAFADTLSGGPSSDSLDGAAGNDVLAGRGGADTLTGGTGVDTLDYSEAGEGVVVDLSTGNVTGGAGEDTITGSESVTGSAFADSLVGDANENALAGGSGNDVLEGGAGDDELDGGAGSDTAVLAKAGGPVTVDLVAGTASGHGADELVAIESVVGSSFDDTLLGNGTRNNLRGGGGNDRVSGRLQGDRLVGGGGNDRIQGAGGADKLFGNAGADRLAGGPGRDLCKGGAGADRLRGCERKA
jgi:Ca2+-binding RTX toxin-like protein